MSYEQALKHWRNHRKDRFVQQCSGPVHEKQVVVDSFENYAQRSRESMEKLLAEPMKFPSYIAQNSCGEWEIVSPHNLFGAEIQTHEELVRFATEYAFE